MPRLFAQEFQLDHPLVFRVVGCLFSFGAIPPRPLDPTYLRMAQGSAQFGPYEGEIPDRVIDLPEPWYLESIRVWHGTSHAKWDLGWGVDPDQTLERAMAHLEQHILEGCPELAHLLASHPRCRGWALDENHYLLSGDCTIVARVHYHGANSWNWSVARHGDLAQAGATYPSTRAEAVQELGEYLRDQNYAHQFNTGGIFPNDDLTFRGAPFEDPEGFGDSWHLTLYGRNLRLCRRDPVVEVQTGDITVRGFTHFNALERLYALHPNLGAPLTDLEECLNEALSNTLPKLQAFTRLMGAPEEPELKAPTAFERLGDDND